MRYISRISFTTNEGEWRGAMNFGQDGSITEGVIYNTDGSENSRWTKQDTPAGGSAGTKIDSSAGASPAREFTLIHGQVSASAPRIRILASSPSEALAAAVANAAAIVELAFNNRVPVTIRSPGGAQATLAGARVDLSPGTTATLQRSSNAQQVYMGIDRGSVLAVPGAGPAGLSVGWPQFLVPVVAPLEARLSPGAGVVTNLGQSPLRIDAGARSASAPAIPPGGSVHGYEIDDKSDDPLKWSLEKLERQMYAARAEVMAKAFSSTPQMLDEVTYSDGTTISPLDGAGSWEKLVAFRRNPNAISDRVRWMLEDRERRERSEVAPFDAAPAPYTLPEGAAVDVMGVEFVTEAHAGNATLIGSIGQSADAVSGTANPAITSQVLRKVRFDPVEERAVNAGEAVMNIANPLTSAMTDVLFSKLDHQLAESQSVSLRYNFIDFSAGDSPAAVSAANLTPLPGAVVSVGRTAITLPAATSGFFLAGFDAGINPPVVVNPPIVNPPGGAGTPFVSGTTTGLEFAASSSTGFFTQFVRGLSAVVDSPTRTMAIVEPGFTTANCTFCFEGSYVDDLAFNPSVARLVSGTGRNFGLPWTATPNNSIHVAFGTPTPVAQIPTAGTFTYNFVGATSPTYSDGSTAPGTLTGAAAINFATLQVGVSMTATMPNQVFTIQTPGGAANPNTSTVAIQDFAGQRIHFGFGNFTTSPTTCPAATGGCFTSLGGQFFGANAAFTSIVFRSNLPGNVSLNGAALGQR